MKQPRKIVRDTTDEDFRRNAAKLIDSAKKEILVITGEIGSYNFPDLKWAAERARKRGVTIKVYASKPPQRIINGLLARGVELYRGPKVRDHYLVVDSQSYMHSTPHAPRVGERAGKAHERDPKGAARIAKKFHNFLENAKPIKKVDWKQDPLWKALQKPMNWRVDTKASRLDEEFA